MWSKDFYVLGPIFLLDPILVYSTEGWIVQSLVISQCLMLLLLLKDLLDEKAGTLEDTQLLFGDSARISVVLSLFFPEGVFWIVVQCHL